MLATGGVMIATIDLLKKRRLHQHKVQCWWRHRIAALESPPGRWLYTASVDQD